MKLSTTYTIFGLCLAGASIAGMLIEAPDYRVGVGFIAACLFYSVGDILKALGKRPRFSPPPHSLPGSCSATCWRLSAARLCSLRSASCLSNSAHRSTSIRVSFRMAGRPGSDGL